MKILEFPEDIFRLIMKQLIFTLGIKNAMRARTVCKAFNTHLTDDAFTTHAFELKIREPRDPCSRRKRPGNQKRAPRFNAPLQRIARMLKERASSDIKNKCSLLVIIRVAVELLLDFRGDEHGEGRDECLSAVCMFWAQQQGDLAADMIDPSQYPQRTAPLTAKDALDVCLGPAAAMGDVAVVDLCLSLMRGFPGKWALLMAIKGAARGGHIAVLHRLWPLVGEDRECMGAAWEDAFVEACRGGHEELYHILLGGDVCGVHPYDLDGFWAAVETDQVKIMRLINARARDRGESFADSGRLMDTACLHGSLGAVRYLLSLGSTFASDGLKTAASRGHVEVMKVLMTQEMSTKSDCYSTPPLFAAFKSAGFHGYTRACDLVIDHGGMLDYELEEGGAWETPEELLSDALEQFAEHDQAGAIRRLYEIEKIGREDCELECELGDGEAPLKAPRTGIREGYASVVRAVLEMESSIDVKGDMGKELMRYALNMGVPHIVDLLVEMRGGDAQEAGVLKTYCGISGRGKVRDVFWPGE